MRPCLAPTLALAALLAPALACLGNTGNDTTPTGSTEPASTTMEVTTGAEPCDNDGLCDPANGENAANCMEDCFCGNGEIEAGEECDDGNKMLGDGCNNDCRKEATKCDNDGIKEDGEACDDGNAANNDACLVSCNLPSCGDGFTTNELIGSEECDEGDANGNTKTCTEQCLLAKCGDGFVYDGVEECDEGSSNDDTASCTSHCEYATCGDGLVQAGEEACDDGNGLDTDACFQCQPTFCGDKIIQAPNGEGVNETCDDETDDCAKCQTIVHRKVFVSSELYFGSLIGGLTGADKNCQALAMQAGLMGNFQAWLSDSTTGPSNRFDTTFTGVYELVNGGSTVAIGWTGLTTMDLIHAIDTTEKNDVINVAKTPVWSNSAPSGDPLGKGSCGDWSNGDLEGAYGIISSTSPAWTDNNKTVGCTFQARIYCFEDPQ